MSKHYKPISVYVDVEYVLVESPYGDRSVIRDSYINTHGDLVRLWHTVKGGHVTQSPERLVADGYRVINRFVVPVPVS